MNSKAHFNSKRICSILLLALVCSNSFAQSEVSEQNGQLSQRVLNLESSLVTALNRIEALEQMAGYYPELSIFDANDLKVGKKVLGLARQHLEDGSYSTWELHATVLFDSTPNVVLTVNNRQIHIDRKSVGMEFNRGEASNTSVLFAGLNCTGDSTPYVWPVNQNLLGAPNYVFRRYDPISGGFVRDPENNSDLWYIASGDTLLALSWQSLEHGEIRECGNFSSPVLIEKLRLESVSGLNTEDFQYPFRLQSN